MFVGFLACVESASAQDSPASASSTPLLAAAIASESQTYLVQFTPQTSPAVRDAWLAHAGAELVAWLPQIDVAEVRLSGGALAAAALAADDGPVTFAEPDVAVSGDFVVSDPAYLDPSRGYGQQLLGLDAAWNITPGSGDVVIAIVDTGINAAHPEFAGRIVPGYDFINKDDNATDDHGHGTHVAGIAAAGINGVGTVGVCPECKLMPVKVLSAGNSGTWGSVSKGILFAVDNGADVINLSLGATISSTTLISAVQYAADHDVVVVAAAGNLASKLPFYPAAAPGVIGVSGTDMQDSFWAVSNYGDYIDVAAPGVAIYSTYYDLVNSSGYAFMSGTSMASPFVAGLAGLVRSDRPDLTAVETSELLGQTAVDLGDAGWDPYYGSGRIDAGTALQWAKAGWHPARNNHPIPDPLTAEHAVYLPAVAGE
jgi:subtilisin family serine protease